MGFFKEVFGGVQGVKGSGNEKTQELSREQLEAIKRREAENREIARELSERPMGCQPKKGERPLPVKDYTNQG